MSPIFPRWISQDPLGFDAGDRNLYRYVNNAPTEKDDPSGEINQGTPNAFWPTSFGKTIWKLLEDGEKYLIKTIPELLNQIDKSKATDDQKALFTKQMQFILNNVGKLRINIGTDAFGLPGGAQAAPNLDPKNPAILLRPYLLFNVFNFDKTGKTATPYTTTPNGDPFKKPDNVLWLPLFGHLQIDNDALAVLWGPTAPREFRRVANGNLGLNKGLPLPMISLWKPNQIAGLLANELLHIAQETDRNISYYHYDPKRGPQQSQQYRWTDVNASYLVYDFYLSFVGTTFADPTSIDSIWQDLFNGKIS